MSTKSLLKFKSNRFLAQNIWPTRKISIKQKNILTKLKKKKLSNFGANFFAKRFLSILYGNLSSNQMQKAFEKANLMKGKIGNNFLFFLEKRLDTVIFRMNICRTFREAQQLINHQKVFVNGNSISIASYQIKSGDIINLSPDSDIQFLSIVKRISNALKDNALCATKTLHLEINFVSLSAIFLYPPQQLIYPAKFEIPKIEK
jgi:small subunit ribosomal protein S4